MHERLREAQAVTLAIAIGVGAVACDTKKVTVTQPHIACSADQLTDWIPTPPYIDAEVAAKDLGVTANEIINGSFGGADCPNPISEEQAYSSSYKVSVSGEGKRCLVLGYSLPPTDAASRHHIVVECAGPDTPAPTITSAGF